MNNTTMRELHLFAGAGGGILGGMMLGHEPVCAVEIDKYCRRVLQARQDDGSLPPFPIYEDVRKFDGHAWRGLVDVICGGFPCQPFSCAGKQLGTADPRHLWPEMARIIEEVRPRYVFAENVSISAFEEPWRDLRRLGYRVPPAICVSASDVGAPHLRKRWWLLATNTNSELLDGRGQQRSPRWVEPSDACGSVPDTSSPRLERHRHGPSGVSEGHARLGDPCWWETEPNVGRVAHGVASRVDRLRSIGNGQVPLTAATAWRLLMDEHALPAVWRDCDACDEHDQEVECPVCHGDTMVGGE
mgnify:CR=1 FL=1